jgi:Predicted enzyme with a TIM-barrel fold
MHNIVSNITTITKELNAINSNTKIIAVSKTFTMSYIKPLVDHGHVDFGENKVQEAINKWTETKEKKSRYKTSFNWKTSNK